MRNVKNQQHFQAAAFSFLSFILLPMMGRIGAAPREDHTCQGHAAHRQGRGETGGCRLAPGTLVAVVPAFGLC